MVAKSFALLLLHGTAFWSSTCAEAPSIEDMLSQNPQTSNVAPSAASTLAVPAPAPPPATPENSIASALGKDNSNTGPMLVPEDATSEIGAAHGPPTQDFGGSSSSSDATNSLSDDSSEGSTGLGALGSVGGAGSSGGTTAKMAALKGMMGAMENSMDEKQQRPDMFGNKPSGPSGGGGGPMAGMMKNPIMHDLLRSVESRMPINEKAAAKAGIQQPISQQSKDIVGGIVEKFMHKVALSPGEKDCLEHNLATLTADVVGTVEDIVKAIKAIMAGNPGEAPPQLGQVPKLNAQSQSTMVSAGLDGAMKLTSLVTLSTTLMKNCVRGDALELMKETGRHFINMQYIGERFLVSGVDIAHRLADGVIAFEKKDWHRFGEDIGISLRKILLSNTTKGAKLPEGVPEEAIIQETTEGLMSGFFTRGTGVEITDAASPEVDIQLDLHRCIAGNNEFFKEIWLAIWNLVAELAANPDMHDMANLFSGKESDGSQPKWMGEFMVAMMQVPMALSRCNIDRDTQQMMMEAIKSIKYLRVNFLFPRHMMTADEATKRMAKAIEAWTNWDFKEFGRQIGLLLEEFLLLMYPQQYSRDSSGRLQKQLSPPKVLTPSILTFAAGGAVAVSFAFVAVRGIRYVKRNTGDSLSIAEGADNEFGEDLIEVE